MAHKNEAVEERIAIGVRRIINILRKHGVATMRTLEQKISDAGPTNQRIDPHILTKARITLKDRGDLLTRKEGNTEWYALASSDQAFIDARFDELNVIHARTHQKRFTDRMGDTAEIAVMRAMQRTEKDFVGHFADLDQHADDVPYAKHDPDYFSGKPIIGGKLDYILFNPSAGGMGIEIKNTREWMYPDKDIVTQFLRKCVQIDVVPVLIARRIHYTTFSVLNALGGVVHQFYNQLYPYSEAELADLVRHKNSLGYFDIRVGNEPDQRMLHFFEHSIPAVSEESREKFDEKKGLIAEYTDGQINYAEFYSRLVNGDAEDGEEGPDWDPDEDIL